MKGIRGTILIADDNAALCNLTAEILRTQGFRVFTASNGQEALEEFGQHQPDLVVSDVVMPKLDGIELCRRIKNHPDSRLTPVVLVTGHSASEDRVRGIEAGADDFLRKPVDRMELFARVRSLLNVKAYTDELERAESVLFVLARSIEGKDPYTEGHCERLSDYSARLGERISLPQEQITALRRAGIVHDIGKVVVPDAILLKPAKLTPEEWQVMREHPVVGERICSPLKSFKLVLPIIRHHHEKLDGSGYPDGLKGDEIPLTARVLQVVDVYDALATERPYRRALTFEETFDIMEEEVKKGWWESQLVAEFRQLLAEGQDRGAREAVASTAAVSSPRQWLVVNESPQVGAPGSLKEREG